MLELCAEPGQPGEQQATTIPRKPAGAGRRAQASTSSGGHSEHHGYPCSADRRPEIADGRRGLCGRHQGARADGSGTGHVRSQPARACADHRHRRLGGTGGTGRGRRADGRRLRRPATATGGGRAQRDRPHAARRAVDRVRFVGEPVAMVITDDAYGGEDAAELVSVDYEPLPVVVGPDAALAGEQLLFPDAGSNIALTAASPADPAAFDGCEVVVDRTIFNQRLAPVPMEGRAAAARWADGKLTAWVSTQNAQISRFILAGELGLAPDAIRVIAPDVGGGFGAKIGLDRDAILVAWAAKHTG